MKKLIYVLLSVFFYVNLGISQKTLDKGHVRLEITEVSADDEQMAAMLQMMKGSYSDFYFDGKKSLAKLNMMGGMMQTTTLSNNADGTITMLFDAMGNKMYVESTEEEKKKLNGGVLPNVKVEYDDNDTKIILGYNTKKAKIITEGQNNMSITAYVAEDIKLSNKIVQGLESIDLDGFPLRYDLKANGITMVMTATKVENNVDADAFNITTDGYTKTTMEELAKNLGGMAGGMGF